LRKQEKAKLTILPPVSTLVPTIPSRSAETLREEEVFPTEAGAKAAAEPARRQRIAADFMMEIYILYMNELRKQGWLFL
jgi:hypothetical protein